MFLSNINACYTATLLDCVCLHNISVEYAVYNAFHTQMLVIATVILVNIWPTWLCLAVLPVVAQ